jgi:Predicted metal-binding integral membrane protein (DUF2182)
MDWGMRHMDVGMDMWIMPQMANWNATDLGLVLLMWAVMMAAMMLPSVLPVILVLIRIGGSAHAAGFIGGYLVAWGGFSVRGDSCALGTARGGPGLTDNGERKRAFECRCAGRRWPVPVHAIEARLSRPLPFAMGCGAQSVERYNRDARGLAPRRFLRRLLLGVDGAAVRRRRHESALDRGHCRLRHRREMGAGRGMV